MVAPYVVGLLGGIGSGKSTVAALFREAGAAVIDADQIAHECLADPAVRSAIRRGLGDDVFAPDGSVDRSRLAAIAFATADARALLESIVHPCVLLQIRRRLDELAAPDVAERRIVILDVPLLLESELNDACATRIFVDAPLEQRRRRVRETRGWDDGELARRENFQKPVAEKRAAAEYKVSNDGPLEPLRARVRAICAELEQRARGSQGLPQQNQ